MQKKQAISRILPVSEDEILINPGYSACIMNIMRKTWEHFHAESAAFVDAQRTPMDDVIVDIVANLRFRDFTTILSCGGHADREPVGHTLY